MTNEVKLPASMSKLIEQVSNELLKEQRQKLRCHVPRLLLQHVSNNNLEA